MRIRPLKTLFLAVLASLACLAPLAQTSAGLFKAQRLLEEGAAQMKAGRLEVAETTLRHAQALNPKNATILYYLGATLMAERKFSQASPVFEQALALDRKNPLLGKDQRREAMDGLGLAAAFQGNLKRARRLYEGAVRKDGAYPGFHYNLACVCALDGDRPAAIEALRKAVDADAATGADPMLPDPSADEDLKGLRGDPRFQAILIMNLGPQPDDHPGSRVLRAGARLLAEGKYAEASGKERAAAAEDGSNPLAWYFLGSALDMEGDGEAASAAFAKALALNRPPRNVMTAPMVRFAGMKLGALRASEGRIEAAAKALETAKKADPYYAPLHYQLARVYARLGKKDEAGAELAAAFSLRDELTRLDPPLPDPAKDPAFARWAKDPEWKKTLEKMVR